MTTEPDLPYTPEIAKELDHAIRSAFRTALYLALGCAWLYFLSAMAPHRIGPDERFLEYSVLNLTQGYFQLLAALAGIQSPFFAVWGALLLRLRARARRALLDAPLAIGN